MWCFVVLCCGIVVGVVGLVWLCVVWGFAVKCGIVCVVVFYDGLVWYCVVLCLVV